VGRHASTLLDAPAHVIERLSRRSAKRPKLDAGSLLDYLSPMARTVHCVKFNKEMEGLEKPPLKGPVGQRIFDNVSKEAWRLWLEHSKMLVNEYRIDLVSPAGQKMWMDELEKYFFGEGSQLPPDYNPQKTK
jgi:Fe-S cluster biosynthesis and repair protein YggX